MWLVARCWKVMPTDPAGQVGQLPDLLPDPRPAFL